MLRGRERESKKWKQIWLDGVIDGKLKNGIKKVCTKKLFTQKKKITSQQDFYPYKIIFTIRCGAIYSKYATRNVKQKHNE